MIMVKQKVKLHSNEKIVPLPFRKTPKGFSYAVTNYGHVISYQTTPEEGYFLKPSLVRGYPAIAIRVKGENKTFLVHRLVAMHFLRQPDKTYKFVVHLNSNKIDNHFQNLKWTTLDQKMNYINKNKREKEIGNYKLTAERVVLIKKLLLNGKTRLRMIGKRFGVTDMQIHRIKTGENWGHVKI
jgi:hypothetical protein